MSIHVPNLGCRCEPRAVPNEYQQCSASLFNNQGRTQDQGEHNSSSVAIQERESSHQNLQLIIGEYLNNAYELKKIKLFFSVSVSAIITLIIVSTILAAITAGKQMTATSITTEQAASLHADFLMLRDQLNNLKERLEINNNCAQDDGEDSPVYDVTLPENSLPPPEHTASPRFCQDNVNPALSCNQILNENPERESGFYCIRKPDGTAVQLYCAMNNPCRCESTAVQGNAWMRIAHLNMSDANEQCPGGMEINDHPRACAHRSGVPGPKCLSAFYSSHGLQYSRVCGRITGYQYGYTNAFANYNFNRSLTIDDAYVDGVSLTHGTSPRKHIWTFAAGYSDAATTTSSASQCPCSRSDPPYQFSLPDYIEDDYFCESGNLSPSTATRIYSENPLWDGTECAPTSNCCSFNNPPWFCTVLPGTTHDDIEVRICRDQYNEDILVSVIEIYVQ